MSPALQLAQAIVYPEGVPEDLIPEILGQMERARAALWARMRPVTTAPSTPKPEGTDRLLTTVELAGLLDVSIGWIYRHSDELGVIRLSRNKLRFREVAVRSYIARKRLPLAMELAAPG